MADLTGQNESLGMERGQRRRGRPPGSTSKKRRQLFSSALGAAEDPHQSEALETLASGQISHKFTSRYQEAVKIYEKAGLTQRTLQILRRIACGRTFAYETQRGPVLQQLIDASKLLFLSELELVVWDMYLTGTHWSSLPMAFQSLLVASGYYVKSIMSAQDTSYILASLTKQIPQFQTCFTLWVNFCASNYSVNPKELNYRYRSLVRPTKEDETNLINYNYYVDDIVNLGCATVEDISSGQAPPMELFHPPEPETEADSFPQPHTPLPPKPLPRHPMPVDTSFREDIYLPSPMLTMETDFGGFSPLLFPYSFAYYTPPQSALPVLEDLESACLRPTADK